MGEADDDGQVARVKCPFHDDVNPSLFVYVSKADVHCYACNWHGDIVDAVSQLEQVRPLKALMLLTKWGNDGEVEKVAASYAGRSSEPKKEEVSFDSLPFLVGSESKAESYMWGRGFSEETLFFFDVRVDVKSEWPVVFPILSWEKWEGWDANKGGPREVLGWQRRSLDDRRGKYKFSRGTHLSSIVAGWHSGSRVVMTEGYFDMMMAWQHMAMRWPVCSPLTWLLRPKQAKQIHFDLVVLALDNDERGREGVELAQMLIPKTVSLRWRGRTKDVAELKSQVFRQEVNRALRRV
jgi:hypothetical protein